MTSTAQIPATPLSASQPTPTPSRSGPAYETIALATAGLTWAAYLLLRPSGDETTLAGAAGIASQQWVVAHLSGMAAFVALAGALTLRARRLPSRGARAVAALAVAGAALVLPYYGAESFGLQAIAAEAVSRGDIALLAQLDAVRYGALAMTTFGLGLLAVIAAGVLVAQEAVTTRSGLLAAYGLAVATMPVQYFLPTSGRIAHGVVVGLVLLVAARRRV